MRTKNVEFDGQRFVISPLNLEQVEEIFPTGEDGTVTTSRGWDGAVKLIVYGLNNAQTGMEPWTPERVRKELDYPTMRWLRDQIAEFSELAGPKKKSPEGPAPAESAIQ